MLWRRSESGCGIFDLKLLYISLHSNVCILLYFLSFYIYKVVVSCCGNFCTIWNCVLSPVREFCHLNAVTSAAPCSASPNNIPVLLIFNNSLLQFVTSLFRWVSPAFLRKSQMSQTHQLSCQLQFGHMAFFALLLASIKILVLILLFIAKLHYLMHPAFKREDRLGKEPFAGFGTAVEDITESGYTKNQPILLGAFWENAFFCVFIGPRSDHSLP